MNNQEKCQDNTNCKEPVMGVTKYCRKHLRQRMKAHAKQHNHVSLWTTEREEQKRRERNTH